MQFEFEVEQKFRIQDFTSVCRTLIDLQIQIGPEIEQVDCYFGHPARDFRVTDEAFRLRRSAGSNYITYKGPRVDTTTKTRREIELRLPDGSDYFLQFAAMLEALGFHQAGEVHKRRCKAHFPDDSGAVEIALDDVLGLGRFVELEIITSESDLDAARKRLARVAHRLGLVDIERRSYLNLLRPEA